MTSCPLLGTWSLSRCQPCSKNSVKASSLLGAGVSMAFLRTPSLPHLNKESSIRKASLKVNRSEPFCTRKKHTGSACFGLLSILPH